ncbi:MAG: 3-phosphoshikimate 1-carboxyvinyltransferase [Simkaniaceae bacterium]|nr:3-phosphoshikimate 1-carboxyvinyltransferase [Simkaniaceae bacterium]
MPHLLIEPSRPAGKIVLPPSKSHTLRALVFAHLTEGKIENLLDSSDTDSMRHALEGIHGSHIDVGNSGIAYRFIAAIASTQKNQLHVTGDASIRNRRPIKPLAKALQELGVKVNIDQGITVQGPWKSGCATIDGQDSQPVSALLIAAPLMGLNLLVHHPGEKPWIDVTLEWLNRVGIQVEREGYERFVIKKQPYSPFSYRIPGDLSTLAFPVAQGLLGSEMEIEGADLSDIQGDGELIDWLCRLGAKIQDGKTLSASSSQLEGGTLDINRCIDTLPILSVLGCFGKAPLTLTGATIARSKECDRIKAMRIELSKMGAKIIEHPDGLTITPSKLHGAELFSHNDHRIAMSLSIAAFNAIGPSKILDASCIDKTYKNFVSDFQRIGGKIRWETL